MMQGSPDETRLTLVAMLQAALVEGNLPAIRGYLAQIQEWGLPAQQMYQQAQAGLLNPGPDWAEVAPGQNVRPGQPV